MEWWCDHNIEHFGLWRKNANKSLWFFLENVENDQCMESIFRNKSTFFHMNFLPRQQLYHSRIHPTRPAWPMIQAISIFGHCISPVVLFEKLYAGHRKSVPQCLSGWSSLPQMVPNTLKMYGIPQLELCSHHSGILTQLVPAWYGTLQMDPRDNVTLCQLPGSGIMQNKSWLPKYHIAHSRCVKFKKMPGWGIQPFEHSIAPEISLFTLLI